MQLAKLCSVQQNRTVGFRTRCARGLLLALSVGSAPWAHGAQEQAANAAAVRQVGTVTALADGHLTVTPDGGSAVSISLPPDTRVLELPPGSTDLKTAQAGTVGELAVGDRVLVTSVSGATGLTARRVVVMKSTAIAQQHQTEQAGWAHSQSGTVETVDAANGRMTIQSHSKTIAVLVTPATLVRQYAADSARFEDAKRVTLADVHVGDQVRVRGEMTGDTMQAAEMVSGAFVQISGRVTAIDTGARTLTVQDVRTKKSETVRVAQRTEIHRLPPEMAAQFAARSQAGGRAAGAGASSTTPAGAAAGGEHGRGERDLGQAVAHLPEAPLDDVKVGGAVLLLASGGSGTPIALTVLSGAEPIVAAAANGGAETSLEPWSMGGGEGAAASQ